MISVRRDRLGAIVAWAALLAVAVWPTAAMADETDAFTRALGQGPLYAAVAALLGGLVVSLTPCVYPMIVITVTVFGARQARSRVHGMLLSTCFVLGIVAMFVPLGVVAGLTGSVFGELLRYRAVNIGIGAVFLALAASMFGAFEMVLPSGVMQRLSRVGGIGYGGAFLLGLVCGIMAAPCTGPVLTGILIWIGKTKSALLGAGAMTAFAVGLGLPFWLVGTFAIGLPKSGRWMLGVKSLFGIVMAVAALYFLGLGLPEVVRRLPVGAPSVIGAAAAIVAGVALGAVHLDWAARGRGARLRKRAGIVLSTVGAYLVVANILAPSEPRPSPGARVTTIGDAGGDASVDRDAATAAAELRLVFLTSEAEALAKAKAEKRPLLLDFTANWCIACGKLSRITFADPRVMKQAARFVAVQIDLSVNEGLTDQQQEQQEAEFEKIKQRYRVVGLPTVILVDSQGKERGRIHDFVPPEKFLATIEGIE